MPDFLKPRMVLKDPFSRSRNVAKSFGGIKAVRGISFKVADRSLHALIGPNGAGKTTAFNLISGMFSSDQGQVALAGRRIDTLAPADITRAGIGRSFQITNLFPALSIEENVRLAVQARDPARFLHLAACGGPHERYNRDGAVIRTMGLAGVEEAEAGRCPTAASACSTCRLRSPPSRVCSCWMNLWPVLPRPRRDRVGRLIKQISNGRPGSARGARHRSRVQLADAVTVMNDGQVLVDGSVEDARSSAKVQEVYIGSAAMRLRKRRDPRLRSRNTLLSVDKINTLYGKSHILHDVSFDVRQNEIVALLGRTAQASPQCSRRSSESRRPRRRNFARRSDARPPAVSRDHATGHLLCASGPRPFRGHERGAEHGTRAV